MMLNIGIYGYGNLGKGVEAAVSLNDDTKLVGVFTRRDPESVRIATDGVGVYRTSDLDRFKNEIDVLIICGGSATDLPEMTPALAKDFNVIDSFDTHAKIPEHFDNVDAAAKAGDKIAMISGGWDPGLFSLARLYMNSVLPVGCDYTFWGRGVSQGHSDAIRRIKGVADARQYTVPVESAVEAVRNGEDPVLTTREKHTRECFVVAEEGADLAYIENAIKTMPNYFADYDTTVHFISAEEMARDHSALPHGGSVIRSGKTGFGQENTHVCEFSLKLDSNPEFTGSVLVAFARAIKKMYDRGDRGCKTVFDVAPADLSALSPECLRKTML
ncbi:MAG: diaminopimelate dehydrogenase [Eubacteriales bacterium]|nr:diaminopimelate dehydrogenase [Eubacteriales bacterium]MDD7393919.1 diaminopimelate dehydrogenase [Eubacteriales bacterium]